MAGGEKKNRVFLVREWLLNNAAERGEKKDGMYGVLQCSGINNHFLELRIVLCLFAPPFSLGERVFFFGI